MDFFALVTATVTTKPAGEALVPEREMPQEPGFNSPGLPAAAPPYIEPELPTFECIDGLDIPAFLRRRVGGWVYPSLHTGTAVQGAYAAQPAPKARALYKWTDAELAEAASADMSIQDRQPILQELHRRDDLKKTRARILKMKEAKGLV